MITTLFFISFGCAILGLISFPLFLLYLYKTENTKLSAERAFFIYLFICGFNSVAWLSMSIFGIIAVIQHFS